ncbi:MAG: tRNA (adenosine(37)-N6)-dimethylallyltransferase MiaA [Candidatus Sungbacteria bacterium]|nr:tRNA (adenosine(37)-N6)-dimethylallyltransferase MiaA [Candidatus Sungbacteria bacterium]
MRKMSLLVTIVGPTASGKSTLAVYLAKRFGGEVISADSRQIYRGLDIGTGKITKREMRGIPHHLLSFASPKKQLSVAEFRKKANTAIRNIIKRDAIPFLVGGTGLYIDAVARGFTFPEVQPNPTLRRTLAKKSATELFKMLAQLDSVRARAVDAQNPRRLIRAIEIVKATMAPVPPPVRRRLYHALFLGPFRSPQELRKRIKRAVETRIQRGLLQETKKLLQSGIPRKRLRELGLDYNIAASLPFGSISKPDLRDKLEAANWDYAKRQQRWFKRYSDIHWIKTEREAERLVRTFLRMGGTT